MVQSAVLVTNEDELDVGENVKNELPTPVNKETTKKSDAKGVDGIQLNVNANVFVPRIKHNENGQAELNLSELQRHFEMMDKNRKHEVPIVKTAEVLEQALIQQTLENQQSCEPAWKNFPKKVKISPESIKNVQKGKGTRVVMLEEGDYFITPRMKRFKRERSNTRHEEPWDPELKSMYGKRFESDEKRREHERKVALEALKLVEQRRARASEKEPSGDDADVNSSTGSNGPGRHISHSPLRMAQEERDRVDRLRKAKKERIERILREMQADEMKMMASKMKEKQKAEVTAKKETAKGAKDKQKKAPLGENDAKKSNNKENVKQKLSCLKKPKEPLTTVEKNEMAAPESKNYLRSKMHEYVSPHDAANKYPIYAAKPFDTEFSRKSGYLNKQFMRGADKENYQERPRYPSVAGDYLSTKKYGEYANAKPLGQNSFHVRGYGESMDYLRFPRYDQYNYGLTAEGGYQAHNPYRMYEPNAFIRPSQSPIQQHRAMLPLVPNNTPIHFNQQQPMSATLPFRKPDEPKSKALTNYARQFISATSPHRSPHDAADPRPILANVNATVAAAKAAAIAAASAACASAATSAKTETKRTYDMQKLIEIKKDIVQTYAQVTAGQTGAFGSSVFVDFEGSQSILNTHCGFGGAEAAALADEAVTANAESIEIANDAAFPSLDSRASKSKIGKQRYSIADLMNLVPTEAQPKRLNIPTSACKIDIMRN